MQNVNIDNLDILVKLSYEFGPFLFSLLFLLLLSFIGQRNYHKAVIREKPPAKRGEILSYQVLYYSSYLIGVILVIISINFWLGKQNHTYSFSGKILDLDQYSKITSDSFYFKPELIEKLSENEVQRRSECFLITNKNKFEDNDKFTIYYSKGGGKRDVFTLPYTRKKDPMYQIEFNEERGRNELFEVSDKTTSYFPDLVNSVYASENFPIDVNEKYNSFGNKDSEIYYKTLTEVIQNERSSVGSKIIALDKINSLPSYKRNRFIEMSTAKEHVLATILDLTRHTDSELAYKAKRIIDSFFNIKNILSNIDVFDEKEKLQYIDLANKMNNETLRLVLPNILNSSIRKHVSDILNNRFGEEWKRLLIPTGSSKGDRYYIKAIPDNNKESNHDCMNDLFLSWEQANDDDYDNYPASSIKSNEYLLYFYSKSLVQEAALEITNCNYTYTFISGSKQNESNVPAIKSMIMQ